MNIVIMGSTGSIGMNTLAVIRLHPDRYRVTALIAQKSVESMLAQCQEFHPDIVVMVDADAASKLKTQLNAIGLDNIEVRSGPHSIEAVVAMDTVDCVVSAIVGAAGLLGTLKAAQCGKRLLLANKESLVMSGQMLLRTVKQTGAELLPVDSEHNAIFQCLAHARDTTAASAGVRKIFLTASGGPFRTRCIDTLVKVTPEEACAHPNWDMGRKISVDSATMMNKGLELIEACLLFDLDPDDVEIVIHPQSIVHSMVSYADGSVLAQLGNPDMRTPIAYSLSYPERIKSGAAPLDLTELANLSFEKPDFHRYPCLKLAYRAIEQGGISPTVLNAANEIAVESFLNREIAYTDIAQIVGAALDAIQGGNVESLDSILAVDEQARIFATELVSTQKVQGL